MKNTSKIAWFAVLALLASSFLPGALASTLTVDLNPATRVAKLASFSTTDLVLAYPENSTLSGYLHGYNSSVSWSGGYNSTSGAVNSFREGWHHQGDGNVSVQNMTVAYSYAAKANSTALVIKKQTDITAWVTGAFDVTNGTVTANLGWKSFYVSGALDLPLDGHMVDVNLVGSSVTQGVSARGVGVAMLTGMFGRASLWGKATLNFSSLSSPLSTWTRNYDSITNTTTFSKTISGNSSISANYTTGGGAYSLSMVSDPSAAISTTGYATASGNSLVFSKAPVYLDPFLWVGTALVLLLAVAGVVYLARRSRVGPADLSGGATRASTDT